MKVRSLFAVPASADRASAEAKPRARAPSLLDLEVEWDDGPEVRGSQGRAWQRSRAWGSEE